MKRNIISRVGSTLLLSMLLLVGLPSCHGIYDGDLPPCPHGVSLRFVYDYNMEYANAFPAKVDCVTLYAYDSEGRYVATYTETSDILANEDYRMQIDLKKGEYHFVAYGGLECDKASFSVTTLPALGSPISDLSVAMKHQSQTSGQLLHNLYFGTLDVIVSEDYYQDETIRLMKDTNNLRIILQQLNGDMVNAEDFDFLITDDNTLFDSDNNIVPNGGITYTPWTKGQASTGITDADQEVIVAYAELSVSRLMVQNAPRLIIRKHADGTDVVNIPLNNYLLVLKSNLYADMGAQEYLDRESEWSMIFFLGANHEWIKTQVIINDWIVRLSDIGLEL